MSSHDTALTQSIADKLKVGLLKERLGGTLWVRAVGDDHVEFILAVSKELEAIADVDLDIRVLEANAHARKVLLGDANDRLEKIIKNEFLSTSVFPMGKSPSANG